MINRSIPRGFLIKAQDRCFARSRKDRESISASFCREQTHDANTEERASAHLSHSINEDEILPLCPSAHATLLSPASEFENFGWLRKLGLPSTKMV